MLEDFRQTIESIADCPVASGCAGAFIVFCVLGYLYSKVVLSD